MTESARGHAAPATYKSGRTLGNHRNTTHIMALIIIINIIIIEEQKYNSDNEIRSEDPVSVHFFFAILRLNRFTRWKCVNADAGVLHLFGASRFRRIIINGRWAAFFVLAQQACPNRRQGRLKQFSRLFLFFFFSLLEPVVM